MRDQAKPWLIAALDAFGPQRCMIGSDGPVSATTAHALGPGEWLFDILHEIGTSNAEREHPSWRTSATFFRLAVTARQYSDHGASNPSVNGLTMFPLC